MRDIDDAIGRIGRDAGITNQVVLVDSTYHWAKLIALEANGPENSGAAVGRSVGKRDRENRAPESTKREYLSREEIEAVKRAYFSSKVEMSDDAEISPPSELGRGVTHSERKEAIASYRENERLADENDVISPGADGYDGLTRAALEEAKKRYRLNLKRRNPNAEVSPPSEEGPGLSLRELEAAKMAARRLKPSVADVISPGDGARPGLTAGELEAAKTAYFGQTK